jgi:LPS sulfotransferase NodH
MLKSEQLREAVQRSYTIAFSPRSGSTEICNLLSRNGLGSPSEFFQSLPFCCPSRGLSSAAAIQILSVIRSNTINGVFGSKMSHDQRVRVDGVLSQSISGYKTVDNLLPSHCWIWLIRRDKIAQAVSLSRAEQSGIWAGPDKSEPAFDYHHVLSKLMFLTVCDVAWQTYFQTNVIKPYLVYYEEFFDNLPASLSKLICHVSGGSPGDIDTKMTLPVQRDGTNAEWVDKFRCYLNRLGDGAVSSDFGSAQARWDRFFLEAGWRETVQNVGGKLPRG